MKTHLWLAASFIILPSLTSVWASDSNVSIATQPVQYASVNGDVEKFRALHWTPDGYVGGVKNFSVNHVSDNGVKAEAERHALIDANDMGGLFVLKKENWGFVRFDYDEFRKYYDGTGGV